jgi:AraC family transcriptional regulator, carnitine catabolism transcriptional activator
MRKRSFIRKMPPHHLPQTDADAQESDIMRFGILLVPGFSHLALTLITEPLFIANWLCGKRCFQWTTLSVDGTPVTSSSRMVLPVDRSLAGDMAFDIILVVASFDSRAAATQRPLLQWLRRAARSGVQVGGVETGAEIVAAAGLLQGVAVPVHWYNISGATERLPNLRMTRELYVHAPGRPLSAGGTATLDLMHGLIARSAGPALADEVALHLLADRPRPATQAQPGLAGPLPAAKDDPAAMVLHLVQNALDDPMSVADLARRAGLSARHLQRVFKGRFGVGVSRMQLDLRMAAAHQLVQQTDVALTEVAAACGFASLSSFSRAYRARFGKPARTDRRQTPQNTVFRLTQG